MACKATPRAYRCLSRVPVTIAPLILGPRVSSFYSRKPFTTSSSTTPDLAESFPLTTRYKSITSSTNRPSTPPATPRQAPQAPQAPTSPPTGRLALSPNLRTHLPLLAAQPPHFITIHLHARPYLVTQGDTLRLPFRMPGVLPGDILRLTCASALGSRDFTLRAGTARVEARPKMGRAASMARVRLGLVDGDGVEALTARRRARGPQYVDERLFVCRAVVLGTESEPLRVKEKTKQRQRRVRRVMSKHRYTVLRISELRVRGVEELVGEEGEEAERAVADAVVDAEVEVQEQTEVKAEGER